MTMVARTSSKFPDQTRWRLLTPVHLIFSGRSRFEFKCLSVGVCFISSLNAFKNCFMCVQLTLAKQMAADASGILRNCVCKCFLQACRFSHERVKFHVIGLCIVSFHVTGATFTGWMRLQVIDWSNFCRLIARELQSDGCQQLEVC